MSLVRLEKSKAFHLYSVSICLAKGKGVGRKGTKEEDTGRYDHRVLHVKAVRLLSSRLFKLECGDDTTDQAT